MAEQAQEGVVTNTAQPIAVVGQPAIENEEAAAGVGVPVANVTVIGTPAED